MEIDLSDLFSDVCQVNEYLKAHSNIGENLDLNDVFNRLENATLSGCQTRDHIREVVQDQIIHELGLTKKEEKLSEVSAVPKSDFSDNTVEPSKDILVNAVMPSKDLLDNNAVKPSKDLLDNSVKQSTDLMENAMKPATGLLENAVKLSSDLLDKAVEPSVAKESVTKNKRKHAELTLNPHMDDKKLKLCKSESVGLFVHDQNATMINNENQTAPVGKNDERMVITNNQMVGNATKPQFQQKPNVAEVICNDVAKNTYYKDMSDNGSIKENANPGERMDEAFIVVSDDDDDLASVGMISPLNKGPSVIPHPRSIQNRNPIQLEDAKKKKFDEKKTYSFNGESSYKSKISKKQSFNKTNKKKNKENRNKIKLDITSSPGPSKAYSPASSKACSKGPSNVCSKGHSKASSPRPKVRCKGPSKASSPRPFKASSPRHSKVSLPGPSKASLPGPSKASSPRPSKASLPGPSKASSPRPSKASSPRTFKASSPRPSKAPLPGTSKAPTTLSSKGCSKGHSRACSPGPSKAPGFLTRLKSVVCSSLGLNSDTIRCFVEPDKSGPEDIAKQLVEMFPHFSPEYLLKKAKQFVTIENTIDELLNEPVEDSLKMKAEDMKCVKERVSKSLLLLAEEDVFKKVNLTEKRDFNPDDPLENKFRLAKGQYLNVSGQHACPIQSIDYVENRTLMENFERKKSEFKAEGKDTREYFLFHGTNNMNVDSILQKNFRLDLAGKHGQTHGRGIYFSEKTIIPNQYMNGTKKTLLLCRVLLGREFLGVEKEIPEGFDSKSVLPDEEKRANINIIKEVDQILPCFVLNLAPSSGPGQFTSRLKKSGRVKITKT